MIEAEMLLTLSHVRYMTTEQICSRFYRDRARESAERRLRELRKQGLLEAKRFYHHDFELAIRVTKAGFKDLLEWGYEPGPLAEGWHGTLSTERMPHLVETNDVFLALAGEGWAWGDLGFEWLGSHRTVFSYRAMRRSDDGVVRVKDSVLWPDALITAVSGDGPRVFLELDRSTERIREKDGRGSIAGKLRQYREFLELPAPRERVTWYQRTFSDGRPVRVVFVLSRDDTKAKDPGLRDRRIRSIRGAAAQLGCGFDLRCVYLRDVHGIREACGLARTVHSPRMVASPPPQAARESKVSVEDVRVLELFYRGAVKHLGENAAAREELRTVAREARRILARLGEQMARE